MTHPLMMVDDDTGYNLTRSLRTRASASASLSRTPASTTNQKTYTYSLWFKRGALGTSQSLLNAYYGGSSRYSMALINSSDVLEVFSGIYSTGGSTTTSYYYVTTQVFRDPSAWYHLVIAVDTTQATAANRVKIYVNGSQVTAFSASTTPAQNADGYFNVTTTQNNIGQQGSTQYFDGYLTEVNFIDGQALTPSSFGSINALTGVWQPARYTGTYGTNGFYLPFTDNSALTTSSNVGLGKDFSGNGNYWTTNNISLTSGVTYDSMTDVPTLTSATASNFAVLNPIGNGSGTISNGNLRAVTSTTLADVGTFAMQSGKWYWEVTLTVSSNPRIGMYDIGKALPTAAGFGATNSWSIINNPSRLYYQGTTVAYGSFVGNTGSVVMIAYDPTNGNLWFGENGSWFASGNPATGASPSLTGVTGTAIVAAAGSGSGSNTFDYNFGQRPFVYTPPTGFLSLNTFNLPTSTIVKGNTVMDATLWTGADTATSRSFSGLAFRPDFWWNKPRSQAYSNLLYDSVRGAGSTKELSSNSAAAEGGTNTATYGYLSSFDSNGVTWTRGSAGSGTNPDGYADYDESGASYVAWAWQAGQGSSSSNTNGTITSTVSVNAAAGFSVVTYTGTLSAAGTATVGHGLGVAPSLIISKRRDSTSDWPVHHSSLSTPSNVLYLQLTDAQANTSAAGTVAAPTSSVFTTNYLGGYNTNGGSFVAYCWTPIAGYSAFGSVSTNGAADNAFVYTGFLPRFVLFKRTDSTSNWYIWDTARNTFNVMGNDLYPNLSNVEASSVSLDIVSNGFKLRSSGFAGTWIYAAFATVPFKNSLGF